MASISASRSDRCSPAWVPTSAGDHVDPPESLVLDHQLVRGPGLDHDRRIHAAVARQMLRADRASFLISDAGYEEVTAEPDTGLGEAGKRQHGGSAARLVVGRSEPVYPVALDPRHERLAVTGIDGLPQPAGAADRLNWMMCGCRAMERLSLWPAGPRKFPA